MASAMELNARQRKHVHMHSTIFSADGPSTKSVYAPGRQQEVYESLKGTLKENNHKPPELHLPSAGDIKCTQMAGHSAVLPSPSGGHGEDGRRTPRMVRVSNPEVLVYDGEPNKVVHASGKDSAIPKEFWSTSVNLQWHDTRNEQCRHPGQLASRQGLGHQELKRQELSSEIFGTVRRTEASTTNARGELQADTADHSRLDSQLHGRQESPDRAAANARARFQQNLADSVHSTLAPTDAPAAAPPQVAQENPANMNRRRQEKNFSDLFGTEMGERRDVRGNREEILASSKCSFLDPRSEIAARNKEHWKFDDSTSASLRKKAEGTSTLFNFACPERPSEPEAERVVYHEGACWEAKDAMQTSTEVARRRRQKDYLRDFEDPVGHTHLTRKQEVMASAQVSASLGVSQPPPAPQPRGSPLASYRTSPRASPAAAAAAERAQQAKTAKDTKLASLQSSIFS